MNKFKVGQKVRLTGRITEIDNNSERVHSCIIHFLGDERPINNLSPAAMSHAEIIEEPPVKFSKEQVEAIEKLMPRFFNTHLGPKGQFQETKKLYEYLDSHTESET